MPYVKRQMTKVIIKQQKADLIKDSTHSLVTVLN